MTHYNIKTIDMLEKAYGAYLQKYNYTQFDIKAVLFDMDGVLFDSMKWHAQSWHETMQEFDIQSTQDEFYMYEGMIGYNTINKLMLRQKGRNATDIELETIYKRKTELFNRYNDNSLIPFALDFVKRVSADNLICGIVTGSGQRGLLDKIDDAFHNLFCKDRMVSAVDVIHGKPHPEPYLMGLKRVGNLEPNQAIVIENAPKGVEASVAAGIFTIAINTGPIPQQMLKDSGADIVLPSMEALYSSWTEIKTNLM